MARSINFVRERQRNLSRQELQDRKLMHQAIVALFIIVGLMVVVVGARLALLAWHDSIKQQQQEAIQAIKAREDDERSYTVFASKLNTLTELFGKRKEKQDALAYFSSLFDPDIIISSLSYSADTDTLNFTIQAPSIFRMEAVFEIMQSQSVANAYPELLLASMRRSSDGKYGMQVQLTFGEAASQLNSIEFNEEGEIVETSDTPVESESEAAF